MALIGKIEKFKEGEIEKEKLVTEFTNGTYEQLKELKNFLIEEGIPIEGKGLEEVISVAIAFIERLRENKSKEQDK